MAVNAITEAAFADEVLMSEIPVVVDYWADWCSPCRQIAPILDELSGEYAGRVKFVSVDTNAEPGLASAQGIMGLPTLQFFKAGRVQSAVTGAKSKRALSADEAAVVEDTEADTAADSGETTDVPAAEPAKAEIPRPVRLVGLIAAALVVVAAGVGGYVLGSASTVEPTVAPASAILASWPMEPPKTLDGFVVGDVEREEAAGRTVVRADYADGEAKIGLVLSRTEIGVNSFLLDAGASDIEQIPDTNVSCGNATDAGVRVCAQLRDGTAIMVIGVTKQADEELVGLVQRFLAVLSEG
ncbi:MAG: hypothetical protein CSA64_02590 [Arachnia propionica]|nr:MAG: hypothetical protein CSA64_02590 [Arachnia propionica]